MNIQKIQDYCIQSKMKWYKHALERMQERDISRQDVKNCIVQGEIIEDYRMIFPIQVVLSLVGRWIKKLSMLW